jgi:SAM-dependent methyltransferase
VSEPSGYEPTKYWSTLLGEKYDDTGVAYPALSHSFNRAFHLALTRATLRTLNRHGLLERSPSRVLDVGSGSGVWIRFWTELGAREIVGLDLTEVAVERLRMRHPKATFAQADVGDTSLPVEGVFDLVSVMSVLLHIVDDSRWRRALCNLADVLSPDGHLVVIDPVVVHRWWGRPFGSSSNSRARHLREWRSALAEVGLELVDIGPGTVLLGNPVDGRSRWTFAAMSRYWDVVERGIGRHERIGAVAAALLGAADAVLRPLMRTGPSTKVMLVRRLPPVEAIPLSS